MNPAHRQERRPGANRPERSPLLHQVEPIRPLVEQSPLPTVVFGGAAYEIFLLNHRFTELFGYTLADIPNAVTWRDRVIPDARDQADIRTAWVARVEQARHTGGPIEPLTAWMTGSDGTRHFVEIWCSILGEVYVATLIDLTARTTAEAGLREFSERLEQTVAERTAAWIRANEELRQEMADRERAEGAAREQRTLLRTLIDAMPDHIFVKDTQGRIILDNVAHAQYLGATPEAVIGHTDRDFFPPEMAAAYRADEEAIVRTGRPIVKEELSLTRRGQTRWDSTIKVPLRNAHGDIEGLVGICRDITEDRQVEDALRNSENRYRSLFEGVPIGLYRSSPEGRILDANPAMVRMLGYPDRESLLAVSAMDLYPGGAPARDRQVDTLVCDEAPRQFELQMRRRDGAFIWVRDIAQAVCDAAGRVLHFEGSLEDITDRKRLEAQFLQAQKMETVGRLAGGVAHDFNNILTAIGGYASLIKEELPPGVPASADIDHVIRASDRATQLTRQLLAFSCRQVIEPQVISLNRLILDLDHLLRRLIGEDIELVTVPGPDLWNVSGDPGQIEQVLVNLAVNARDAMPSGGCLTIETANVALDAAFVRRHVGAVARDYVLLAVSDTGIGMTEEVKAHAFEPFFTTKGPGKGSGLGLATAYGIVKQHLGLIWVYSEPGRGSAFKIYLPRVDGGPDEAPRRREAGLVPRGEGTVLVVEDEDAVRSLSVRTLTELGYTVLEAGDGEEALQVYESHSGQVDLLFTDVVMPRLGGKELADRLTAAHPDLKVLFASGYTDNAFGRQGALDQGVAFLQKPFSAPSLARKVHDTLKRPSHSR